MIRPANLSTLLVAAAILSEATLVASPLQGSLIESAFISTADDVPFPMLEFGDCLAFEGGQLFIGAATTTTPGASNRDGTFTIYDRTGASWTQSQVLLVPNINFADGEEEFGDDVAVSGDRMVLTAPGQSLGTPSAPLIRAGAAFLYERNGSQWVRVPTVLENPLPSSADNFGEAVAMSGEWIAVGAYSATGSADRNGMVHMFECTPGGCVFRQTLTSPSPVGLGYFGGSVSMDGPVLAVGEPGDGDGKVDIFELQGGTWVHAQTLQSDFPGSLETFGHSVSLSGSVLAVGCQTTPPQFTGAVVVFEDVGPGFIQAARFNGSGDPAVPVGRLGASVEASADLVVAGAFGDSPIGFSGGAAHLFRRTGPLAWSRDQVLLPAEASEGTYAGWKVDIAGEEVAVAGPRFSNSDGEFEGGVWVFSPMPDGTAILGAGDGSVAPCPCGNESTPGRMQGCLNISGLGAQLLPHGSASLVDDDLRIDARNLNGVNLAILFAGPAQLPSPVVIGNGLLFSAPPFSRFPAAVSGEFGEAAWSGGLATQAGWSVGQTIVLQAWYRDVNPTCVATFNTTNAVSVTVAP